MTLVLLASSLVFALAGSIWPVMAALLAISLARRLASPLYMTWLNEQITDSSVRATVISLTGQSNAVGQAAGGPVLGVVANVWGIGVALTAGAASLAPALGLYTRALAHRGREPELEEIQPAEVVIS